MKRRWIVSGGALVTSVVGIAGVALAAPPFTFTTVANSGDIVDAGGDTLFGVAQIAVNNQGDVGISSLLEDTNSNGVFAVLYSTPGISSYSTNVALNGENYTIPGFEPTQDSGAGTTFNQFTNLAITGTALDPVLTFYGSTSSNDQGVLQYDSATTAVSDVAFENDTNGYQQVGDTGLPILSVNASSNALYPAETSASKNVIQYGQALPRPATVFTSGTGGLTLSLTNDDNMGVGADGTSAAVLSSGSTPNVYLIPASGSLASPTVVTLPFNENINPTDVPQPIVGYTSGVNGLNQAVVMEVYDVTTGKDDVVLSQGGGNPTSIISAQFSPVNQFYGQLTPNGQFAAILPGPTATPVNTIVYGNLANAATTKTIASESPAVGPTSEAVGPGNSTLPILSLQLGDSYPDVNSNGAVAFEAEIGPLSTPADDADAVLLWQPGDTSPQIVLSAADSNGDVDSTDVVNIDGEPALIDDFDWNPSDESNNYFESSLSDNYLALDVDYTYLSGPNQGDSGNAVIITQVPEPGCLSLLGLGAFGLMRRRRQA
jgi:PEP-CTERM motif